MAPQAFDAGRFLCAALSDLQEPALDDYLTRDFTITDPVSIAAAEIKGAGVSRYFRAFRQGFSILRVEMLHDLQMGEHRVTRHRVVATHRGGWLGCSRGGQPVSWHASTIWHTRGNKVDSMHTIWDALSVAKQLGFERTTPLGLGEVNDPPYGPLPETRYHYGISEKNHRQIQFIREMTETLMTHARTDQIDRYFNPNIEIVDPVGCDVGIRWHGHCRGGTSVHAGCR